MKSVEMPRASMREPMVGSWRGFPWARPRYGAVTMPMVRLCSGEGAKPAMMRERYWGETTMSLSLMRT